jgi:hypothetical protein
MMSRAWDQRIANLDEQWSTSFMSGSNGSINRRLKKLESGRNGHVHSAGVGTDWRPPGIVWTTKQDLDDLFDELETGVPAPKRDRGDPPEVRAWLDNWLNEMWDAVTKDESLRHFFDIDSDA